VYFLQFLAAVHTLRVNCDEIAGDRPRKPAKSNCYSCHTSHELLKLHV